METIKEKVKPIVIQGLHKFIEEERFAEYSCTFIEIELEKSFNREFSWCLYLLTPEVLYMSKDVDLYSKNALTGSVSTKNPFLRHRFKPKKQESLRKRFCLFALKNLEAGVFDLDVEDGTNELTVKLILTK